MNFFKKIKPMLAFLGNENDLKRNDMIFEPKA